LDHVFGRIAPLPCEQLERRGMPIDKLAQQVGIHEHFAFASGRLLILPETRQLSRSVIPKKKLDQPRE
jgi:hypothetical protein